MKVITIGRNVENDVVINDPHASRHHLQIIQFDDGSYRLADFGSTNGTYVNGQKVSGEVILKWNDVVRIGNTTLRWHQYFENDIPQTPREPSENPDAVTEVKNVNPKDKQRHGFVTFWLWLMIIGNVAGAIMQAMSSNYAIWAYATEENATLFFYVKHSMVDYYIYMTYIMTVLSLINIASAILLLKWKKFGYWLFVGSAVACLAIMISFGVLGGVTTSVVGSMIGAILGPVILWAILQIKKNGISCWKQLE